MTGSLTPEAPPPGTTEDQLHHHLGGTGGGHHPLQEEGEAQEGAQERTTIPSRACPGRKPALAADSLGEHFPQREEEAAADQTEGAHGCHHLRRVA